MSRCDGGPPPSFDPRVAVGARAALSANRGELPRVELPFVGREPRWERGSLGGLADDQRARRNMLDDAEERLMAGRRRKRLEVDVTRRFDELRRDYFARWDRERQWTAAFDPKAGPDGRCDLEARRIVVPDASSVLLVHQICHALAGPEHGEGWKRRLLKVADDARARGESVFAMGIGEHAIYFRRRPTPRDHAISVYRSAREVVAGRPDASVDEVIAELARRGGTSQAYIRQRFTRLLRVVAEARRRGVSDPAGHATPPGSTMSKAVPHAARLGSGEKSP